MGRVERYHRAIEKLMDLLTDPSWGWLREAYVSAAAMGVVCSLLSVLVVLKRMAFIGQGVSHAGFGGHSLALFFGLEAGSGPWQGWAQQAVVVAFCVGTGLGIGRLVRSRRVEADTAIGVLLVAGVASGVLLQQLRLALREAAWYRQLFDAPLYAPPWEKMLFGSMLTVGPEGMWTAVGFAAAVIGCCVLMYKELVYFAFDETASRVSGVPTRFMHDLVMVMVALVVVVGMKLVGFVLVSALLVIPGAAAMQLSRRLGVVLAWSLAIGTGGTLGGMVMVTVWGGGVTPGAGIVAVLVVLFALSWLGRRAVVGGV